MAVCPVNSKAAEYSAALLDVLPWAVNAEPSNIRYLRPVLYYAFSAYPTIENKYSPFERNGGMLFFKKNHSRKGCFPMELLVIESSPHKHGSSNLLAEEFIGGAEEAGHTVRVFDAARADLHPCLACGACGMDGPCVQKDGMARLREAILAADMAVFVTPLYYFGMSAQLKTVIDRFYSFNGALSAKGLKTALIAAAWDSSDWAMRDLEAHYKTLCRYLNFQDQGMILGTGCGTVSMTRNSKFPRLARELGNSL